MGVHRSYLRRAELSAEEKVVLAGIDVEIGSRRAERGIAAAVGNGAGVACARSWRFRSTGRLRRRLPTSWSRLYQTKHPNRAIPPSARLKKPDSAYVPPSKEFETRIGTGGGAWLAVGAGYWLFGLRESGRWIRGWSLRRSWSWRRCGGRSRGLPPRHHAQRRYSDHNSQVFPHDSSLKSVPSCQYPANTKPFRPRHANETGYWLLGTGYWLSENCIVVKPDIAARSLLGRIHHTGIKRPRIDVQCHRTLIRFPRIDDPVHRLLRINGARIGSRQLHGVRCLQLALPASIS